MPTAETLLALAKFHLGQLSEPRHQAEELSRLDHPAHRHMAELWLALGDDDRARYHALAGYREAWADGVLTSSSTRWREPAPCSNASG